MVKTIRTASGLGDGSYLIPIIRQLVAKGEQINVLTHYRELYHTCNCGTLTYERYAPVNYDCSYVMDRDNLLTTQYEDVVKRAGLGYVPFEDDYIVNDSIFEELRINTEGKKVCIIAEPYTRTGKGDLKNEDITPSPDIMQAIIDKYKDEYIFLAVGFSRNRTIKLNGVIDLKDKTSLGQFLQLIKISDMIITQCGNLLPFGEIYGKRVFCIFNKKILDSSKHLAKTATPDKCVCAGGTQWVWSDNVDRALELFDLYKDTFILSAQATELQIKRNITDKRVVIFGSAPSSLQNNGDDINGFDTIIRVNGTDSDISLYKDKIGNRTDIHYSFYGTSIKRTTEGLKKEGVKVLWSKIPYCDYTKHYRFGETERRGMLNFKKYFDNFRFKGIPLYLPKTRDLLKECRCVDRMLSSGVSAIRNILKYKPKELYITGFDFFQSGKHNISQEWRNGDGGHKTQDERNYVKELVSNANNIRLDKRLKEVLC